MPVAFNVCVGATGTPLMLRSIVAPARLLEMPRGLMLPLILKESTLCVPALCLAQLIFTDAFLAYRSLSSDVATKVTVMVTVAMLESRKPSLALYVNVSVPLKPGFGVYVNEPLLLSERTPLVVVVTSIAVNGLSSASVSFA